MIGAQQIIAATEPGAGGGDPDPPTPADVDARVVARFAFASVADPALAEMGAVIDASGRAHRATVVLTALRSISHAG